MLSRFYEEAASVVERRAVDDVGSVISRTEAAAGWSRSTLGLKTESVWRAFSGSCVRGARWRDLPEQYPDGSTCNTVQPKLKLIWPSRPAVWPRGCVWSRDGSISSGVEI
jgi:hypothetical protein